MKITRERLAQIIREEIQQAAEKRKLTEATVDQVVKNSSVATAMKDLATALGSVMNVDPEAFVDGVKGAVAELIRDRAEESSSSPAAKPGLAKPTN